MAHYAFIDESTPPVVTEVIVGNDETTGDWETYYAAVRGQRCLRTSYHTQGNQHALSGTPFRGNYAGIGMVYLAEHDIFVPPCPGEGWTLDTATASYVQA
jgi:hypothetical protein